MGFMKEGDVFEVKPGMSVQAMVPEHLVYSNRRGSWKLTPHVVNTKENMFAYLNGKYIVTKTATDGGGSGHGSHDVYPDGHHIWAEKVDTREKIEFYQSGSFYHCNKGVEPIGKGELRWIWEQK